MSKIGRREYHFVKIKSANVDELVSEIRSATGKMNLPEGYSVRIFKDPIVCCGVFPNEVTVEISGSKETAIKDLDKIIVSKIIKVCEENNLEHHSLGPLDIV